MIHLPASVRVYLCLSPCDMRRSFDGLHALVRDHLQLDAFAGHLYLFANKRRDRLKILYWDRDGFAIWAKRLEAGTFAIPSGEPGAKRFEITVEELGALLSGIDLSRQNGASGSSAARRKNISNYVCFCLETARFAAMLKAHRAAHRSQHSAEGRRVVAEDRCRSVRATPAREFGKETSIRSLLRELLEAQRNRKSEQLSKEQLALFESLWKASDPEEADEDAERRR